MKKHATSLYIVDDNNLMVTALESYLKGKFGDSLKISTFGDGKSCLEKVDDETNIVILDYYLNGQNGLDVLKLIKKKNPKTEVIMLSSNEDIALAIKTFRAGASDYVVKGYGAWKRVTKFVTYILMEPVRIISREFGVSIFVSTFLLTFITMGIVVAIVLHLMGWI